MPHTGLLGSHDGMDNIVGVIGILPQATLFLDSETFPRAVDALCTRHGIVLPSNVPVRVLDYGAPGAEHPMELGSCPESGRGPA